MNPLRRVLVGIRGFLGKKALEEGMDAELRFHLDMEVESNLLAGMTPQEAHRAARISFGGVERVKEQVRDARSGRFLDDLQQDLRYALRTLKRKPGFTLLATLSLALGIGANTAVFPAVNTFFFKPLAFQNPESLHHLSGTDIADGMAGARISWDEFRGIRDGARSLAGAAAYTLGSGMVLTGAEKPLYVRGSTVSHELFGLLGIPTALGRSFLPGDEDVAESPAVLISHGLWVRAFGEDPDIIGRVVEVEGVGRSIVGVIPSGREFPEVLDLWVPFRDEAGADVHRRAFEVVVRLADGIAPVSASADLESLMPGLEARRPPGGYQIRPDLQALKSAFVQEPKVPILIMYLLTSMVLLVACFNVATLLLARGSDRAEEIAVRAGLGAGRGRILRQLLAESAVLAFLGALPGLALGALGLRWLMNTVPIQFPGFIDFSLDPLAVVGMSAVVVGAGVVAGFWPALHGSRTNLAGLLRGGRRVEGVRFGSSRGRAVLVGGQISLTLAVLVGAGMMLKGQAKSGSLDLGFQPAGLLGAYLELEEGGVVSASDRAVFLENLEARMARIPGVEGFSVGTRLPIRGQYYTRPFDVGGEPRDDGGFNHTYFNQVQDDYFQLLQTPVVEGRGFQSADGLQGAPQVAVVDRAFADRHWPGESALGRTVRVGRTADGEGEWDVAQVVGVVETARYLPLVRDPGVLFRPYGQDSGSGATIVLRSSGDPLALRVELERVTQELQPSLPYHFIETAEDMIRARNWAPSLYVAVFNLMGLFGVLMASVGIFGMVTTAVARRNREFGLRLVVGATRADLRRLVLKDGGRIVLSAAGLGLILGFAFAQGLSSLAPGVSAFDPTVYLGALILTLAVSTLAAAVPALRAGRGDLVKVLKSE